MSTGLWAIAGVPHRGWSCIGIADLGSPAATCQMCAVRAIRYVHTMAHPAYPYRLDVGCHCAEHMEATVAAARERERDMKSRASRRKRWSRLNWRPNHKGNYTLRKEGYTFVVMPADGQWIGCIKMPDGTWFHGNRQRFRLMRDLQLAMFDYVWPARRWF